MNILLDRRIRLQQVSIEQGNMGQQQPAWTTIDNVWAARMDLSGSEFFESRKFNGFARTLWTIRFRSDVDNLDRVRFDGLHYNIVHIKNLGRERYLGLLTAAPTPDHPQPLTGFGGQIVEGEEGQMIFTRPSSATT